MFKINGNNFDDFISNYFPMWQRILSDSEMSQLFSPIKNQLPEVSTMNTFRSI